MASDKKHKNRPAEFVACKQGPQNLSEWIQFTEVERPPQFQSQTGYVRVYGERMQPTPVELKEPTVSKVAVMPSKEVRFERSESKFERIARQLKILWADVGFWKLVSANTEPYRLRWHVRRDHGLLIPEASAKLWKQLVKAPDSRAKLFTLVRSQEWRWAGTNVPPLVGIIGHELSAKKFKTLLDDYFSHPEVDMCAALASREFSKQALKAIREMATRLAEDADWCLGCQNQVPSVGVRNNKDKGRPKEVEVAERLEELAKLIKAKPRLSDSTIMRLHTGGKEVDHIRKSVGVARELLRFREGLKTTGNR